MSGTRPAIPTAQAVETSRATGERRQGGQGVGQVLWVWQGVAYCAQKRPGLEWHPRVNRVFLDFLHFGRPVSPILRATSLRRSCEYRFVIVRTGCREITGQDGIFRHEKVVYIPCIKALKKLSHIIF